MSAIRRGFTLIELLLVLVLLVSVVSLTMPAVRSTLDRQRLQKAARAISAELAGLRTEALKSGQIFAFQCQSNHSLFRVGVWPGPDPTTMADDHLQSHQRLLNNATIRRLPDGVAFVDWTVSDERSQFLRWQADSGVVAGPWSAPVFLFPDGTASDAVGHLRANGQHKIAISLRSLTGSASVRRVNASEF